MGHYEEFYGDIWIDNSNGGWVKRPMPTDPEKRKKIEKKIRKANEKAGKKK